MTIPSWYEFVLLALASWRVFKLLAEDDILNRPRRYVTGLDSTWKEGDSPPKTYRFALAEFITCPFCLGFWVATIWWGAFQLWPHGTTIVAVPFAISAAVPLVNHWHGD